VRRSGTSTNDYTGTISSGAGNKAFSVTGLQSFTNYDVIVAVTDGASNSSTTTVKTFRSWDTSAPVITTTTVTNTGTTATITYNLSDSGSGLRSIACSGNATGSQSLSGTSVNGSFTATGLSYGANSLTFTVTDRASDNNSSYLTNKSDNTATASGSITVTRPAPTFSAQSITGNSSGTNGTGRVAFSYTAVSDSGNLSKIEFYVGNTLRSTANISGSSSTGSYNFDTGLYNTPENNCYMKVYTNPDSGTATSTNTNVSISYSPPTISSFTLTSPSAEKLRYTWSAADTNSNLKKVEFYDSGNVKRTPDLDISGSSSSTYSEFTVAAGTYGGYIKVFDHGGLSVQSSTVSNVVVADGTAPASGSASVTVASATTVGFTVNWTGFTDNVGVTQYKVYTNTSNSFSGATIRATLGNVATTVLTGLSSSTTYYAFVTAGDLANNWSTAKGSAAITTLNAAPTSTNATVTVGTATASGFTVSWSGFTDAVGVTQYKVHTNTANSFSGATLRATLGNVATTVLTGLSPGTTYYAFVTAGNAANNWSAEKGSSAITTLDATAPVSTSATVTVGTATTTGFTVTWSGFTDNVGVTQYKVYTNTANSFSGATLRATLGNVLTTVLTGLVESTTYYAFVTAGDAADNWSTEKGSAAIKTLQLIVYDPWVPFTYEPETTNNIFNVYKFNAVPTTNGYSTGCTVTVDLSGFTASNPGYPYNIGTFGLRIITNDNTTGNTLINMYSNKSSMFSMVQVGGVTTQTFPSVPHPTTGTMKIFAWYRYNGSTIQTGVDVLSPTVYSDTKTIDMTSVKQITTCVSEITVYEFATIRSWWYSPVYLSDTQLNTQRNK